ncbi:hypothetical protein KIH87_16305 [Paraneptunicella aestuarii]|nr:hypothetical protein [Paraneptunicella aestuarii]UAA38234.1 hypothetical protein KIH87_16305 [Paraneptunicella aestuarii]
MKKAVITALLVSTLTLSNAAMATGGALGGDPENNCTTVWYELIFNWF